MTKSLTIGIPCYNESITIGKVITDFRAMFPDARILVIDNASSDDTSGIARAHGAEVVGFSAPNAGSRFTVTLPLQKTEKLSSTHEVQYLKSILF